jgi:predicted acyltransferase
MKDSASRLAALEHPLTNLIAIILITVGYSRAKRLKNDRARFRSVFLLYGLGLVLILSRIPWRNWIG